MHEFSVFEVNDLIKRVMSFEEIFYGINVKGEISNFKLSGYGHVYFTLKDEKAQLACVFFKEQAEKLSFMPCDGMYVVVRGDIKFYEVYGKCQLYGIDIKKIEEKGEIYKKLEQLKVSLKKEGLFSLEKKRVLPKFPKVIGVVAAKGGAAIEDVIKVISNKFPIAKLYIFFATMQGKNAVKSIIKMLNFASKCDIDVLILARGGGAVEDLKTFDDEKIVRKVYDFKVPVVSAIGHENDWSITDLVADARASTPSVAADMVCFDVEDIKNKIYNFKFLLKKYLKNVLDEFYFKVEILKKDILFFSPNSVIINLNRKLSYYKKRIKDAAWLKYDLSINRFEKKFTVLKCLDVNFILKKGFALILDEDRKIVNDLNDVEIKDYVYVFFKGGRFKLKIVEKSREKFKMREKKDEV